MAFSIPREPTVMPARIEPERESFRDSIAMIERNNLMMDPGNNYKNRVKKDVLWKPLLLRFRNYYRKLMVNKLNLQQIVDPLARDLTHQLER